MKHIDLIVKYLAQEASGDELNELQQWVKQSVTNENEFAQLKNSFAFASSKISSNKQSANFEDLINQFHKNKKPKFVFSQIYKIAAAIFFPILMAFTGWHIYNQYLISETPVFTEVIAPPKNSSQDLLSDGTQIWLSPESKIIYQQNFGEKNRTVKLIGEGYFEVVKNSEKPFIVRTHGADVTVLGTSFNVEAYPDEDRIKTTLVRGAVELSSEKLKNKVSLAPGDLFVLDLKNNSATVEKVNTEIYRLVKDGLLIFKRNNLSEVCKKLERWFMVPIEYDEQGNQDLLFTAKFEDESIEQILKIVSETIPINYQIRNDQIIIKYKN